MTISKIKIKILRMEPADCYECNNADFHITDWDEVTEEEYRKLLNWANSQQNQAFPKFRIFIVTEPEITPATAVKEYLQMLENEKKEAEEKRLKKEEAKKAREAKKRKKKREEEKALFNELKKKYGDQ